MIEIIIFNTLTSLTALYLALSRNKLIYVKFPSKAERDLIASRLYVKARDSKAKKRDKKGRFTNA
jgi:hypothetical protein